MNSTLSPDSTKRVVAVLGAGSWGTALALLLAGDAGLSVRLWDRTPALLERVAAEGENARYLPGFPLPANVVPSPNLGEALAGASCVVAAVPSGAVRDVLSAAAPHLPPGCDVVLAAKGMEAGTDLLPAQVAEEVLEPSHPVVGLSGPNLAAEVAKGVPAAAVAACPVEDAAARVAAIFNRPTFRVYTSTDRTGVEIGGAVKNVLAIAGGISDGLGYGDNTKAALLTRGLAEMARFGEAMGARRDTFYGLAGVGDLMATAASRLSRNYRVGEGLAKGETLEAVLERLGQVAEGVPTAKAVANLASRLAVETPVCAAVARVLFEGSPPGAEVAALMGRARKGE